jgi:hypothetical protein
MTRNAVHAHSRSHLAQKPIRRDGAPDRIYEASVSVTGSQSGLAPQRNPYHGRVADCEVQRIPNEQVDGEKEWYRVTPAYEFLGVGALKTGREAWPRQVSVSVAEFVRDDHLRSNCTVNT